MEEGKEGSRKSGSGADLSPGTCQGMRLKLAIRRMPSRVTTAVLLSLLNLLVSLATSSCALPASLSPSPMLEFAPPLTRERVLLPVNPTKNLLPAATLHRSPSSSCTVMEAPRRGRRHFRRGSSENRSCNKALTRPGISSQLRGTSYVVLSQGQGAASIVTTREQALRSYLCSLG